jgi:hypothetical protein
MLQQSVVHTIKDDMEGMQVIRDKKAGGMREKKLYTSGSGSLTSARSTGTGTQHESELGKAFEQVGL